MSSTLNHKKNADFLRYRCGRPSRIINLSYAIVVLPASRGRTRSVSRRDSGTALSPNGMHKSEAASIVMILHCRRTICTNPMHRQCLLSILDLGTDSQGEWVWPGCPLTKRECELHSPFLSLFLLCFSSRKPSGPIKITHYGQLSANSCSCSRISN